MKPIAANDVDNNSSMTINFLLVILLISHNKIANEVENPKYNKESE
jgi:hypothetical protein